MSVYNIQSQEKEEKNRGHHMYIIMIYIKSTSCSIILDIRISLSLFSLFHFLISLLHCLHFIKPICACPIQCRQQAPNQKTATKSKPYSIKFPFCNKSQNNAYNESKHIIAN